MAEFPSLQPAFTVQVSIVHLTDNASSLKSYRSTLTLHSLLVSDNTEETNWHWKAKSGVNTYSPQRQRFPIQQFAGCRKSHIRAYLPTLCIIIN